MIPWRGIVAITILVMPRVADAHLVSTRFGEFYSGLLHPLTTLVHLVPWLALALLAALQGRRDARHNLLIFPLFVAIGAAAGAAWPGMALVTAVNIASFIVLGGLVALAWRMPAGSVLLLAALFGFSHGLANGNGDLAGGALLLYIAGVAVAAYLVATLVAGGAVVLCERAFWGRIALRALGSWILAAGLIFGAFEWMSPGNV